jgi:lipoprotein-anchoring transpeptidase ErfK/SrfK
MSLVAFAAEPAPAAPPVAVPSAGHILWSQIAVRARPDARAARIGVVSQFESSFRPRVVLALAVRLGEDGRPLWYRISLPGRPNGRTGWAPAAGLELRPMPKEIVIDRSARRLELRERGRLLLRTSVAVGAPGMETPTGTFYVTRKFSPAQPILGAYAFATSAYSRLSEWPGGGIVGIHGTNAPSLLGQAVSHGCIRVANAVILRLARLVPVGTPVRIVA